MNQREFLSQPENAKIDFEKSEPIEQGSSTKTTFTRPSAQPDSEVKSTIELELYLNELSNSD